MTQKTTFEKMIDLNAKVRVFTMKMINLDIGLEVFAVKIMTSLTFEINKNNEHMEMTLIEQDITVLL